MKTKLLILNFILITISGLAQDFKINAAYSVVAVGPSIYTAYATAFNAEIAKLNNDKQVLITQSNTVGTEIPTIQANEKKVKAIDKEIKIIQRKLNTLSNIEDFKNKTFHYFFNTPRSDAYFNVMYSEERSEINFLNNSGFNLGSKSGSVYTELASGNMSTIRLSLGTMVANSAEETPEESTEEEAFQRLATKGGNTVLALEYPLIYWSSRDNQYNFISRFIGKATADFPAFGTQTEDFAGSGVASVDFYIDASTTNGDIRLYSNLNLSRVYGTDIYRENLAIENSNFNFGKLAAGIIIKGKFNLSVIVKTFSTEESLKNKNVIIGGSFIF